jgi:hypothetical protein
MNKSTRRHFLRGAGVALALPWLESMQPRGARGEAPLSRRRFVGMTFPNGVADFWKPTGTGSGNDWSLSPILEPLTPLKSRVTVLDNVGNYSPFGGHIEPSHGHLCGSFMTCTKANGSMNLNGGTSVDQIIAQSFARVSPLPSLQVGLSTMRSSFDGLPEQHSRCNSWASPTRPIFPTISPQAAFDTIFGVMPPVASPTERAANKSILDQVIGQAQSLQPSLSRTDRGRLDEFLTSVRDVEMNIVTQAVPAACTQAKRPTETYDLNLVPPDYNRNTHADIMIDLIALALQCDITRVVTIMMDDARSDFVYNFLPQRKFTAGGSTEGTGVCGNLHGFSAAGNANDVWATINRWFVEKLARLGQKLQALTDGPGGTVLDQSVIWFGSEMHGGNHDGLDLPVLYLGGGGGRLEVDQRIDLSNRDRKFEDLANVYLTFIRNVFDMPVDKFGVAMGNFADAGTKIVPEILA